VTLASSNLLSLTDDKTTSMFMLCVPASRLRWNQYSPFSLPRGSTPRASYHKGKGSENKICTHSTGLGLGPGLALYLTRPMAPFKGRPPSSHNTAPSRVGPRTPAHPYSCFPSSRRRGRCRARAAAWPSSASSSNPMASRYRRTAAPFSWTCPRSRGGHRRPARWGPCKSRGRSVGRQLWS
jgi:hypothetical protein